MTSESAGTNGFLFCDLRGYTAFVERHGDQAAAELLATYRTLVRAAIAAHAGAEIKTEGDSVYVVFPAASGAVEAGLDVVRAVAEQSTKERPIRVGVGIHAGETVATTEGLVGGAVNIAARVCAKAQAGEVLVTDTVRALTRTYLPYRYTSLGTQQLKGISGGIPLYRVEAVPSTGRARLRRQLGARRGRVLVLAGLVVVLIAVASGVYAVNRPTDCLTLPAGTKDVVAKIDPARNCVVATYPVGFGPGPIVSTPGAIWVGNLDDATVTRLDLASGATHVASARGRITAMAGVDAGVWVLDGRAGRLTLLGASDGRLKDTLLLPPTPSRSIGGVAGGSHGGSGTERDTNWAYWDLAAGGGKLWVASRVEGTVLRIDPRHEDVTNPGVFPISPIKVVPRPSPVPGGLPGEMVIPETGIGLLTFADGQLWISDISDALLWRVAAGSDRAAIVSIAGGPASTSTLVASSGITWLLHENGTATLVDGTTAESRIVSVGALLNQGVADAQGLWVTDGGGAVLRLDRRGTVVTRVALPGRPYGVAVDGGFVWVSIQGS